MSRPARPGLAKARTPPFFTFGGARVRGGYGPLRDLLDRADVVSEGQARDERAGRTWYGSTSFILAFPEAMPAAERSFAGAVAARDLHVRLRAVRAAEREARSRSPQALGTIATEIRFSDDPRGLRIDVDVQAPLIETTLPRRERVPT